MTVGELIELLSKMPKDAKVVAESCFRDYEVGDVLKNDDEKIVMITWL